MYSKLNRPTIEIKTQKTAKSRDVFIKISLWNGGTETKSKNRGSQAHINWTYVTCGQAKYGL